MYVDRRACGRPFSAFISAFAELDSRVAVVSQDSRSDEQQNATSP